METIYDYSRGDAEHAILTIYGQENKVAFHYVNNKPV